MKKIKSRSEEITLVLPLKSGENIKKDLYKINLILDQMLKKDKKSKIEIQKTMWTEFKSINER